MKHLLSKENWRAVSKKIERSRKVILFLDYDGTLTPLRPHPSQARLSSNTKSTLKKLAGLSNTNVCIISGRSLEQIRRIVGLENLVYVGNHGLEILLNRHKVSVPRANQVRTGIAALCREFQKLSRRYPGCWVEDKGLTASLHYRQVSRVLLSRLSQEAKAVYARYAEKLALTDGKKVWEIRPRVNRDKAWAVRYVSGAIENGSKLEIYLGDDFTDLSALAQVHRRGGIAVIVGPQSRKTKTFYWLNSSGEVYLFLRRLLGLLNLKTKTQKRGKN